MYRTELTCSDEPIHRLMGAGSEATLYAPYISPTL